MIRSACIAVIASATLTSIAPGQTKPSARPVINGGFPLVSPSAPVILFESNRSGINQLYLVNADGSAQRHVTQSTGDASGAQWLPGGKSFLYTTTEADQSAGYDRRRASSPPRMVRTFRGPAPRFSPARDYVLYDAGPWPCAPLVRTDPRGLDPRQMTD